MCRFISLEKGCLKELCTVFNYQHVRVNQQSFLTNETIKSFCKPTLQTKFIFKTQKCQEENFIKRSNSTKIYLVSMRQIVELHFKIIFRNFKKVKF